MVPGLVDLLRAGGYDAVMFDSMAPWGYLAARKTGLPLISSKGLLALNPQVLLTSGVLPKMAGFILSNLGNLGRYQREAKALEQQFGLPIPAFSDMLDMPGDLTIVYTSRQFQPLDAKFPDFLYVGPSLDEREKPSDFPFDTLTGAPLIYISLGTVNNDALGFYKACFEAFGGGPQQVVLSVGKRTPLDALGEIPANFIVRPHVPQLQVLQRAALFITHGGMNSVHEGLYYHVPLVVVPQTLEQTLVAKQVERLKAGVVLLKPDAASLRQTANRVLNHPGYRANAASVAQGFRDAGGYPVAADAVQQFLKSKRGQPVGVTA
jgi:MGT family glycosyltransferase